MSSLPVVDDLFALFTAFKNKAPGFEHMDEALDVTFPNEEGAVTRQSWACALVREASASRAADFLTRARWTFNALGTLNQERAEAFAEAIGAASSDRAHCFEFGESHQALMATALECLSSLSTDSPVKLLGCALEGSLGRCEVVSPSVISSVLWMSAWIEERLTPDQARALGSSALWRAIGSGSENAFLLEWSATRPPDSPWGRALRDIIAQGFSRPSTSLLEQTLARLGLAAIQRREWDGAGGAWERQAARLSWAFAHSHELLSPEFKTLALSGALAPEPLRKSGEFKSELERLILERGTLSARPRLRTGL